MKKATSEVGSDRGESAPRRAYEPPAIRAEEVFETVAASCTRVSPALPPVGCGPSGYQTISG